MLGLRFGSAQSAPAASAGFRFLRFQFIGGWQSSPIFGYRAATGARFQFLTANGALPEVRQTSATTPAVVTASSEESATYAGWKALSDLDSNFWSPTDANPWVQIDFGSIVNENITGVRFVSYDVSATAFKVFTSKTGSFSGEETLVGEKTGIVWNGGFGAQDFIF